jgi:hypothetical protein
LESRDNVTDWVKINWRNSSPVIGIFLGLKTFGVLLARHAPQKQKSPAKGGAS